MAEAGDGAKRAGEGAAGDEGLHDPVLHGGLPGGAPAEEAAGEAPAAEAADAAAKAPAPKPRPVSTAGGAPTWDGAEYPVYPKPEAWRIAVAALRLALIVPVTLVLFAAYLLVKAAEKAAPGLRPARHFISGLWARVLARIIGIRIRRAGRPMKTGGALVANHSSWSDILVLMGAAPITFVSKAEVKGWPGIGTLASAADTMFIERKRTEAKRQEAEMARRFAEGQKLLFFPEATSSDALRVLPFKSTLFSVFFAESLREEMWVQPVTVVYRPKPGGGRPRDFYGWWGEMGFGHHIVTLLTRSFGGEAEVVFHEPVHPAALGNRKALCAHCDREVREGLESRIGPPPAEIVKDD